MKHKVGMDPRVVFMSYFKTQGVLEEGLVFTWLVLYKQDSREVTITRMAQQERKSIRISLRSFPPSIILEIIRRSHNLTVPHRHVLHLCRNAHFKTRFCSPFCPSSHMHPHIRHILMLSFYLLHSPCFCVTALSTSTCCLCKSLWNNLPLLLELIVIIFSLDATRQICIYPS